MEMCAMSFIRAGREKFFLTVNFIKKGTWQLLHRKKGRCRHRVSMSNGRQVRKVVLSNG